MSTVISSSVYSIVDTVATIRTDLDTSLKSTSGGIIGDDYQTVAPAPDPTYNGAKVIIKNTEPTGLNQTTDVGTIWRNESTDPPTLKQWTGYAFVDYTGVKYPAGVGLDAYYASMFAAGLTTTALYNQSAAPAHANGRLHRDTDDGKLYRSNGTTWFEIADLTLKNYLLDLVAFLTSKTVTFPVNISYQAAAPGGATKGALWYDTDDALRAYWFDGVAWVSYTGDARLAPETDGFVPPYSPAASVQGGFDALFVYWDEVPNRDLVTYDVYISTVTPVVFNAANLVASVQGSLATINTLPDGSPLANDVTYYVKVRARDADGYASIDGAEDSTQTVDGALQAGLDAAIADFNAGLTTKSKHTLSANAPTVNDANNAGDVWERHKAGDTTKIIDRWRGGGGTAGAYVWTVMDLDATYIPLLDIGSGTFGDLSGSRLVANSVLADRLTVASLGGTSLVANGGFEETGVWSLGGTASRIQTAPHSGAWHMRLTASGGQALVSPEFPVAAGDVLSLLGWAKVVAGPTGLYLRFAWKNAAGAEIGISDPAQNVNAAAAWTRYGGAATAPAGTVKAAVHIYNTAGTVDLDDIDVRPVIVSAHIGNGAITTPALHATAVNAQYLTAQNAWIEALRLTSLVGETITGAIVRTSTTATSNGVQMTSAGLFGYKGGLETFKITSAGDVEVKGAIKAGSTVDGTTITGSTVIGATIQTDSGSSRAELLHSASGGVLRFYWAGIQTGYLESNSSARLRLAAGNNTCMLEMRNDGVAEVIGGFITTGAATIQQSINVQGNVNTNDLRSRTGSNIALGGHSLTGAGGVTFNSGATINTTNPPSASTIPNTRFVSGTGAGGNLLWTSHANSSIRYKENLVDLSEEIDVNKVLSITGHSYDWREGAPGWQPNLDRQAGFIAEHLEAAGFQKWLGYDEDGLPSEVDYAKWTILLQLVAQNQERRIQMLEDQLAVLTN